MKNKEITDKTECTRCGDPFDFCPYWENKPVCYACYFMCVGDYKVEKEAQLSTLSNEISILRQENEKLRELLTPFAEYAKAIPDSFKDTQPLTITLDMPAHTKSPSGGIILDITIGAKAFRNTLSEPKISKDISSTEREGV